MRDLYDEDGKICQNVPKSFISTRGVAVQQNNNSASVCEWITPFVVILTAEAECCSFISYLLLKTKCIQ